MLVTVNAHFKGRVAIEQHATGIPEALRRIDPDLKLFYNMETHQYEVWGLDRRGPYMLGAWEKLGHHILEAVSKGYYLARNTSRPWRKHLQQVRQRNAAIQRDADKQLADIFYGVRDELRWFGKPMVRGWRAEK